MPTLKQITCSVQLGPSDTKLKEYGHRFTDGGVEAFIAVPDTKIPFNVRVTSSGYIAPGLAAYVFMDGQYQCNRNRQRLQLPAPGVSTRDYEVDFRLRQKEEKTAEGTFVAREWTFAELKTGNADKAPDTNPAFAKNVGTIEVVILRCKGDAAHDPAETVIDGGGETGFATTSRAPSVAHSAPAAKVGITTRPASKAPSKAPSKEPSAADDNGMGGMFGLFDGAGDDPGYGRRMPGYYDDRAPLPRYRHDVRDDPRYSPRPFTVHGGHGNRDAGDQRAQGYDTRPRTANDRYAPPGTPHIGYDFQQRRGFAPESVQESPMPRQAPRPYNNAYTPRAPSSSLIPRDSAPEGFHFILNACKEIDDLYRFSFGERQKGAELAQEARAWEHDPEMHLSALKALRYKQQELQKADEELAVLRESIYARMRRMEPKAWQYTRDFLVLEVRLFDRNDPQMQQWPDPRLQQHLQSPDSGMTRTSGAIDDRTGPSPRSNDGWEEVGHGETSGGLQQRQMRKQSGAHSAGGGWDAKPQQGNSNWANDAVDEQAEDDNRGDNWGVAGDANNNGAWGADSGSNKGGGNDDWNADDKKSDSRKGEDANWGGDNKAQSNNGGNDGWSTKDDNNDAKQDADNWANNNDGAGSQKSGSKKGDDWAAGGNDNAKQASGWGSGNQDNKSQSARTKTQKWDDGGKQSQAAGGWGSQSKAKSRGGGGDWQEVGAGEAHARSHASSRRPARTTTSVALEPVIKPYWADWNKPQQDTTRPRVQPRDPYEYPRPATVLAPSGRARDVSHGVQAGRGADYAHKTFRPEYLDTMDKPYAIFTFKYRSQSALEKILKRRIDTSDTKRAVDEAEMEKLMRLPKDELVQDMLKMMRLNPPRSGGSKSASAAKAPSNTGWGGKAPSQANNDWGGNQQRDDVKPSDSVSNHTAKRSNRGADAWGADDAKKGSSRKSKADGGGWAADAGNGGDAWGKQSNSGKRSEKKIEARKPWSNAGGDGWGNAPAAGGNDDWGAGGGDDTWEADKAGNGKASSNSEEHFPGDQSMKVAGDTPASWAGAGW